METANTPIWTEEDHGGTTWIRLQTRGAEASWMLPQEAVELGKQLIARFGKTTDVREAVQ